MKRMRGLMILLGVAATFGVSLNMARRVIGLNSPWFAVLVMFCFLGLVAFGRPLFTLKVPSWLRKVRAWEVRGGLYRTLGVPVFGEILRRTPLRILQPLVYLKRYPDDPEKVQTQIEGAEAAHFWAALLIIPSMVYACVQNRWSDIFWFTVVQVVGNVYPILHLRWVRGRLKRVLDRKLLIHASRSA